METVEEGGLDEDGQEKMAWIVLCIVAQGALVVWYLNGKIYNVCHFNGYFWKVCLLDKGFHSVIFLSIDNVGVINQ